MEKLLEAILKELQAQRPTSLGFCAPPIRRRIYCNLKYAPTCLYFWDGSENKHEPIGHTAINCFVESIDVVAGEYKGKPNNKAAINIQADVPYTLVIGIDTLTLKSLLLGLLQCDLGQPVTFSFRPGDVENSLFCDVFQVGDRKRSDVPLVSMPESAVLDMIAKAQAKINPATPTPPQPQPSPTPAPTHAEWDGQQSLTPVDNRGIADRFLADLAAAETLEAVDKLKIHLTKEAFGPAFSLMRQKWEQKRGSLAATETPPTDLSGLVAEISVLVDRCGWKPKHGSAYLVETYGKRTRAELTLEELLEFRDYLTDRAALTESISRLSQSAEWDRSAFLLQNFGKMELQLLSLEQLQTTEGHLQNLTKQGVWA